MKFIVTVDTEADHQKDNKNTLTVENLKSLPKFQALCEKYNIKPTYLVTFEAISHEETAFLLRKWQDSNKAEVGTHLHPWTTPPSISSDDHLSFPTELSDKDLQDKFISLHRKIIQMVNKDPVSYRSGRWGFDDRQAKLIAEFGYLADCSITPGVNWQRMGGPDFRKEKIFPHRLSPGILEVPMTILPTLPLGFRKKWLRVFPNSKTQDWEKILDIAQKNNLPALMFMVHSSELHMNTSKYTMTEDSLSHMYYQIETIFSLFSRNGVDSITLGNFAKTFEI